MAIRLLREARKEIGEKDQILADAIKNSGNRSGITVPYDSLLEEEKHRLLDEWKAVYWGYGLRLQLKMQLFNGQNSIW